MGWLEKLPGAENFSPGDLVTKEDVAPSFRYRFDGRDLRLLGSIVTVTCLIVSTLSGWYSGRLVQEQRITTHAVQIQQLQEGQKELLTKDQFNEFAKHVDQSFQQMNDEQKALRGDIAAVLKRR